MAIADEEGGLFMNNKNNIKLYNMVLPPFLLLMLVPKFLVLSLAINFVIDSVVLIIILLATKNLSLGNYGNTIFKVWGLGFASDYICIAYMIGVEAVLGGFLDLPQEGGDLLTQILSGPVWAVNHDTYFSVWSAIFIVSGVLISALCIFLFNYKISFKKLISSKKQRAISALVMALITAPYTFLLPKEVFYH